MPLYHGFQMNMKGCLKSKKHYQQILLGLKDEPGKLLYKAETLQATNDFYQNYQMNRKSC